MMMETKEMDLDVASLERFADARLSVLQEEERLEVRAVFEDGKVEADYFGRDNAKRLVGMIDEWHGARIMMTLNPTLKKSIKLDGHVREPDVMRVCWVFIDVDPIRQQETITNENKDSLILLPKEELRHGHTKEESLHAYLQKLCSTDEELERAKETTDGIIASLIRSLGLSDEQYMLGMSGNGYHLLIRTEADVSSETHETLKYFCYAIENKFSSDDVRVEAKPDFAATSRVIGIVSDKKESPEHGRTRRTSMMDHCPDALMVFPFEKLEPVATEFKGIIDAKMADKKAKSRQSSTMKTRPSRSSWDQLAKSWSQGHLSRPLPDIDFHRERIGYGEVCPKCQQRSRQCLMGSDDQGNEWVLCWRPECWDGEEGEEYLPHDFGSMGIGAFYWMDGTPIYNETMPVAVEADANPEPMEDAPTPSATMEMATPRTTVISRPEPKKFYLPAMRDGLLKDIAEYFRIAFSQEKTDAVCLFNALDVISLMNHNRFRLKVHDHISPLNLWLLLIAESGTAKSSMFDKHRSIYNAVVKNLGHDRDYRLPYSDTCSIEALVEMISIAPHKVFTFRSDELARFFREPRLRDLQPAFMGLYNGEYDTLYKLNAAGIGKDKKKKLSDMFRGVDGIQFNLLAQSTKKWLFEESKIEHFENGFYGRFFTLYDDDETPLRSIDLYDTVLKDRVIAQVGRDITFQEIVHRCSLFYRFLETFSSDDGGTIRWSQHPDIMEMGIPKRPDDLKQLEYFTPPSWTLEYFVKKFRSIAKSLNKSDAVERAIYSRLVHQTMKVAALIELSHLGDEQDPMANLGTYGGAKEISIESLKEASDFVIGESVKWIRLIGEQAVDSTTERYTNSLRKYLQEHFAEDAKEYTNSDGSTFKAITRKDIKKRGTLRTAGQIDLAVENLAAFDEIEIRTIKAQNGKEANVLLYHGN